MDVFEKAGLVVLGIFLSAIGYFVKRWIEGKPQNETLNKHKKLLDIHKQMNDQGLNVDGLRNLETQLLGKESAIKKHTSELTEKREPLIAAQEEDLTQLELNERASERFEIAKQKLQEVYAGIDARVGDRESQALMNSQKMATAWIKRWPLPQLMAEEVCGALRTSQSLSPLLSKEQQGCRQS